MRLAVLGAGAWGTALALQLANNGHDIHLWEFDKRLVKILKEERHNSVYLPGIVLPENIFIYDDILEAIKDIQDIFLVVPSHAFHGTLLTIDGYLADGARIAWGTKGFTQENQLLHNVVADVFGEIPMAIVSGPTFAKEVAMGLPTAITVAANNNDFAKDLAQHLHSDSFRVYTSSDIAGVEVGGAIKNVLAIAVGIADGMGFGANARCALITRGLAELSRLGMALGAKQETLMGLSGLGDLVLTCTDDQSRNRRFGIAIGQGADKRTAVDAIGQVVEGIAATRATYELAQQHGIDMPITEQIFNILYHNANPEEAAQAILGRSRKSE
ncbi:MAG: NAD(P)-dependent glycerol-3-phosphate dehydrogenase [Gammaproteobacteria bacterium]|nr:NAD(P)-dependent glycerol-3-phosphate dehydrogenase [Gammaproteobacteria bacterium]